MQQYDPTFPPPADIADPFHRPPIPEPLEKLVEQQLQMYTEVFSAYRHIRDRAVAGEQISSLDFEIAEHHFNTRLEDMSRQVDRAIKDHVEHRMQQEKIMGREWGIPAEMRREILRFNYDQAIDSDWWDKGWNGAFNFNAPPGENTSPGEEWIWTVQDETRPFIAAFKRNIAAAPHRKETRAVPTDAGEVAMISGILATNRGVAVADIHIAEEAPAFFAAHMEQFKRAGVDTIYTEYPTKEFILLNEQSAESMREHLKENESTMDPREIAEDKMWIAAKEQGIRIVNIDKRDPVRSIEEGKFRIASTNFTWSNAVEQDRQMLSNEGKPEGKFIVFGGQGHFLSSDRNDKGLVDDALGIPVIAFTRRDKGMQPEILRGNGKSGADFYLPGGADYWPTRQEVMINDLDEIQYRVERISSLPGGKALQYILQSTKNAIETHRYRESHEADPQLPVSPSSTPVIIPSLGKDFPKR